MNELPEVRLEYRGDPYAIEGFRLDDGEECGLWGLHELRQALDCANRQWAVLTMRDEEPWRCKVNTFHLAATIVDALPLYEE